jgi:hypothetical protein
MTNETATTEPIRRRWTLRRIAVAVAILLGLGWLAALFVIRDQSRAKAIEIYESLTPGMHLSQVNELLANKGIKFKIYQKQKVLCIIDDRFHLGVDFDSNETLCGKIVFESSKIPSVFVDITNTIGLPLGPLLRSWPKTIPSPGFAGEGGL